MRRWVALLRGVNVGAANRLPMAELRSTIQGLGFESVATYIQSGNIVFRAPQSGNAGEEVVERRIRRAIAEQHGFEVPVVVRPAEELLRVANSHHLAGSDVEPTLLHVLFLDREPSADSDRSIDPHRYEPDRWVTEGRHVYVTYPNGSARSKLTIEVFERAYGVNATARNLNTVRKLAAMLVES